MSYSSRKRGREDAETGVPGLDDILAGGFARDRVYLLEGSPGTGKTTAALQFLVTGARNGERGLYITLSETEDELRDTAMSHNMDLAGLEIFELVPPESLLDEQQQQSLLYSSDLELGETTRMIFEAVEKIRPSRMVIEPVGNPPAGAKFAALPSSGAGAEALLRQTRRDCASAR